MTGVGMGEPTSPDGLATAVNELARQAGDIRTELRVSTDALDKRTKAVERQTGTIRFVGAIGGVLLLVVVVAAVAVSYGNRQAIADNNRKFCPIITAGVVQPGDPLPTSAPGILRAMRAREAAEEIGCPVPDVKLPPLPSTTVTAPAPQTDATPQPAPTPTP
jgi:hypothetical protein